MNLIQHPDFFLFSDFINDPRWDAPFFKRLSKNDSGSGRNNQAGVLITLPLRLYFPPLDAAAIDAAHPTTDVHIVADLFLEMLLVETALVRYQFQTRGGRRSPEPRITGNLGSIRSAAQEGDILIFQRERDDPLRFRIILIRNDYPIYRSILELVGIRREGALFSERRPVAEREFHDAIHHLERISQGDFLLMRPLTNRAETRLTRIVRNQAFPNRVKSNYNRRCAISGIGMCSPVPRFEVEAAHVVPVEKGGSDDLRNGLALCRTIHWAFDRGLIGINPANRRVYVPQQIREMPENEFIASWHNQAIQEVENNNYLVHDDALNWHFENCVRLWE